MPAPKRPNTAAATAAVVRRGQETMAAKLREAGWICLPPADNKAELAATLRDLTKQYTKDFVDDLIAADHECADE